MAGEFDHSHREDTVWVLIPTPRHEVGIGGPDSRQAVLMQLQPSWSVI